MKILLGLLFSLLSAAPTFANEIPFPNEFSCTINYTYALRAFLDSNKVELWEIAGSLGHVIYEDKIVKKQIRGNTVFLQFQKTGLVKATITSGAVWGAGTWNHSGQLDNLIPDADDANANGVAELFECVMGPLTEASASLP